MGVNDRGSWLAAAHAALSCVVDPLLKALEWAIVCLAVAMLSVVFVQVVLRYGFNASFYGSEELARFLFTWFVFLSAALGLDRGLHFSVDVVVDLLPGDMRRAVGVVVHLVVLSVLIILIVEGTDLAIRNWRQLSSAMQVPLTYAYMAIPAASVVMAAVTLRRMLADQQGHRRTEAR